MMPQVEEPQARWWWTRKGRIARAPLPRLAKINERVALRLVLVAGSRWIETENEERFASHEGPLVLALNHLNNLEAVMTPAILFYLRDGEKVAFLSDWMFRYYPVLSWLIRRSEVITVWRKDARLPGMNRLKKNAPRVSPLLEAERRIRAGQSVAFYPEGRRNRDPQRLLRGHEGVARVALSSEVAVMPIGIDFRGRPSARRVPVLPRLVMRFGEPMTFEPEIRQLKEAAHRAPDGRLPAGLRRAVEKDVTARIMLAISRLCGKRVAEAPPHTPLASVASAGAGAGTGVAAGAEGHPREDRTRAARPSGAGVVTVEKVTGESQRDGALRVVGEVYVQEKGWMDREELDGFPGGSAISWFMVRVDGEPSGLLRLVYDPPLAFPPGYDVRLREGVDWIAIASRAKIVEVGRFMIVPLYRTRPKVVMRLMNAATREVVERGYTHLLTDVFDGDPHSPLEFHTRVLGFERIGTHTRGEMKTACTRIILALDIQQAYLRMRARGGRLFYEFTEGFREILEERLATTLPSSKKPSAS